MILLMREPTTIHITKRQIKKEVIKQLINPTFTQRAIHSTPLDERGSALRYTTKYRPTVITRSIRNKKKRSLKGQSTLRKMGVI